MGTVMPPLWYEFLNHDKIQAPLTYLILNLLFSLILHDLLFARSPLSASNMAPCYPIITETLARSKSHPPLALPDGQMSLDAL